MEPIGGDYNDSPWSGTATAIAGTLGCVLTLCECAGCCAYICAREGRTLRQHAACESTVRSGITALVLVGVIIRHMKLIDGSHEPEYAPMDTDMESMTTPADVDE